ncbi:hypothetical protein RDE2_07270 [Rhodococcus sp. RDE2]|nr:hypothetical protein RDE2_07270 [Rhodococcus sp. RDE2]
MKDRAVSDQAAERSGTTNAGVAYDAGVAGAPSRARTYDLRIKSLIEVCEGMRGNPRKTEG